MFGKKKEDEEKLTITSEAFALGDEISSAYLAAVNAVARVLCYQRNDTQVHAGDIYTANRIVLNGLQSG